MQAVQLAINNACRGKIMVKTLAICNGLLAVAIILLAVAYHNANNPKNVVYDYCNNSRISDMTSEQTCGDLQDFYHMEFLCTDNNNKIDNKCWVEEI